MRTFASCLALSLRLLLGPLAAAGEEVGAEGAPPAPIDPLAALGLSASEGAAAGYVEDRACGICHRELAESYREVGMSRSFYRPRRDEAIERFDGVAFHHPASRRTYEMRWQDGELLFRRYREGDGGETEALFERRVDWILGSGHSSRSYLFQTAAGELYQLPIAWYSEPGRWGMAPGYDRPDHQGVTRRVRRECMFCHNGYPEVPAGFDLAWSPQSFPSDLPEGTGCQRCHGPGAEHARIALRGPASEAERAALGSTIVNPARLPPGERDSVCLQCHLQPSVAFTGVRRFDRPDYSFRPGEPLAAYLLPVDPEEAGRGRGKRFEINHHPYRLMQSRCWSASEGRLSCLTCHDPHRKVPAAERAAHYRAACLSCHQNEECGRDEPAPQAAAGGAAVHSAEPDCIACHMPRRRTEDVIEVAMTDHYIRRRPPRTDLLAPLGERNPVIRSVELFPLDGGPRGAEAELYRAVAGLRGRASGPAVEQLRRALDSERTTHLAPWLDLARGYLQLGLFGEVESLAGALRDALPGLALIHEWLGIAQAARGAAGEAEGSLRRSLELDGSRPEAHFNLGLLLLEERPGEAVAHLERAVELRPVLTEGWYRLADAHQRLGHGERAVEALRRTLAVDPDHRAAARALGLLERDLSAARREGEDTQRFERFEDRREDAAKTMETTYERRTAPE